MSGLVEQYMEKCRHFTGISNQSCKAGIVYETVILRHAPRDYESQGRTYSSSMSVPCLSGTNNLAGATCPTCIRYTREEAEANEAEATSRFTRMLSARAAVLTAIAAGAGDSGYVECPSCGNRLGYGRASNGHIRASCDTVGCTAWIE